MNGFKYLFVLHEPSIRLGYLIFEKLVYGQHMHFFPVKKRTEGQPKNEKLLK